MHFVSIAASHQSYNQAVLRVATQLAPEDVTIDLVEIDDLPPFNVDQDPPARVVELKHCVREADAILFITPEYNDSIPGVLENAIEWAACPSGDNPWSGKPVAVMGASTDALDTARAQFRLRKLLASLNMFLLNEPELMIGAANERFDTVGKLTDEETTEYVGLMIEKLVDWTRCIGKNDEQPPEGFLLSREPAAPASVSSRECN
ncbi:MAG TPA: NAD(P)H-dependent oxidoreductase [Pyrinomonadaceae bacterium]|nr:NAD(P)H-dependent oxidoreductase [Pyrinomonadaceae bacterium]